MKVREFSMEDYSGVKRVWDESGLETLLGDSKGEVKSKLERDPDLFLVAEEGGSIVGTVMGGWDGRRGWVYHLGVLPRFQRRGVATALIKELETRLKAKGAIKVNAVVYGTNARSLEFFRRAGFKADTRSVLHGKVLRPERP